MRLGQWWVDWVHGPIKDTVMRQIAQTLDWEIG